MKNLKAFLLCFIFFLTTFSCKKEHPNNTNNSTCGNVTDADGNVYTTVKIGTQCWMQQNLKTAKYNNGAAITEIDDSVTWIGTTTPACCYYNGNAAYEATYGKLYNWYAVTDTRGVCPTGYHVPTDSEWTVLINYLGGVSVAGSSMKSTSGLWLAPNTGATNSSGFTALPGGARYGTDGSFGSLGGYAGFWSSTPNGSLYAWYSYLYYVNSYCEPNYYYPTDGFSVRCVGD